MTIQGQIIRSPASADAQALPASIGFLARYGIAVETLAEAARIARTCGVEPDEALIRSGLADEEIVYRALASETGLPFLPGQLPVHRMARFPEACLSGLVPLECAPAEGVLHCAYAPRGAAFHDLVTNDRPMAPGLAIVTPTALRRDLMRARARAEPIADLAADGLPRVDPNLSAREGLTLAQCLVVLAATLTLGLCGVFWPGATWLWLSMFCGIGFLGVTALRLASVGEIVPLGGPNVRRLSDRSLPVYTILVPLYRERRILPRLIAALAALDYPVLGSKLTRKSWHQL